MPRKRSSLGPISRDAKRMRQHRNNETADAKAQRRQQESVRHSIRRANETTEERDSRREQDRLAHAKQRARIRKHKLKMDDKNRRMDQVDKETVEDIEIKREPEDYLVSSAGDWVNIFCEDSEPRVLGDNLVKQETPDQLLEEVSRNKPNDVKSFQEEGTDGTEETIYWNIKEESDEECGQEKETKFESDKEDDDNIASLPAVFGESITNKKRVSSLLVSEDKKECNMKGQNCTKTKSGIQSASENEQRSTSSTSIERKNKQEYECKVCHRTFALQVSFAHHGRRHKGEQIYECELCHKTFARLSELTKHTRKHTGEKPYICEVCGKGFAMGCDLIKHRRIHTGEQPYKCEECGKTFAHSNSLTIHITTHTGKRPHKCEVCNKTFASSSQLTRHTRKHTGEKPYECSVCHKTFSQIQHLTTHTRTHTGEKPFECEICHKSFAEKKTLTTHTRTHTGEKPFKCKVCRKAFASFSSLSKHRTTHRGETI